MNLSEQLRELLASSGAVWVGFADLSVLPAEARRRMPRAVCMAVTLDPKIVGPIIDGPNRDYHAEYCRVNARLNRMAESAAAFLKGQGFHAFATPATLDKLDRDTLWTPLPHKTVATRAGFGWIGKCALLVSESFGSAFRLASVLTDAGLPVGQPITESRCGECTACVQVCPGHAPSGRTWKAGMNRSEFFDAFACCKAASEQAAFQGIPHTICGRCIAACPWTRKYLARVNPG